MGDTLPFVKDPLSPGASAWTREADDKHTHHTVRSKTYQERLVLLSVEKRTSTDQIPS